jgi:hypothetical protein
MPLIEAGLAFAITMLALSLVCSTFVEIIHRIFAMREAGLKYMLEQMFDQVLTKYIRPGLNTTVAADPAIAADARTARVQALLADARKAFVARMSANRAPMGVTPKATPADPTDKVRTNKKIAFGLWGGRDLTTLTPAEFMERLGSIDIGVDVKEANIRANGDAKVAGAAFADVTDAVLKDVAQKFDAFGKEAGAYFEGRARLLSVLVAILLAFLVHVDAIDLFRTYLSDPNARAKVIEQSQAVTAQYKASQEAAEAIKNLVPDTNAAPADEKTQVEKLEKDWKAAVDNANTTVKQYTDLGVPLGWTPERISDAEMSDLIWFCPAIRSGGVPPPWATYCKKEDRIVWLEVPTIPRVWFYLLLGGLLIGLGSPFWYDVVTGLTSVRDAARGKAGTSTPPPPQAVAAVVAAAPEAGKAQPVTPVGAFQVSSAAIPP